MGKTKIIKIKLKEEKEGKRLEIDWTEKNDGNADPEPNWRKPTHFIHADLDVAIENLYIHLAMLTGYIKPTEINGALLKNKMALYKSLTSEYDFVVHGYAISGEAETRAVIISGHVVIWSGEKVDVDTPEQWLLDSPDQYQHIQDLREKIDFLEDEVIKYLNGEKYKEEEPDPQGKLFGEGPVTNIQIEKPTAFKDAKKIKPQGDGQELSEFSLPVDKELKEKVKRNRRSKEDDEDTDPDLAA